ncbi:Gfo/Idh/MocA family oxidoreductase [Paenibacillus glycanilyticus]|uniref:Gfo/Idh/MocA family protein n=1 Tax=Paenibacillus glycanilyticus TaxID=126569 RepID=UPI00203F6E7B|nr:Gfo/Idh/MocA family oxidoreductase [Paenibacillus glycanilyticus]MCM3626053.1 Gfo/Idh/MocA family oxidoreductase [Paenibacillus glycanilyticus]
MSKKLRIGFVGVGGMGQMAHLSNYAVLKEECEVVAIAEPRLHTAQLVANRYGVPEVYNSHLELLEHSSVDAIIAPQPFRNHPAIIPDLLRSRIPVLTEKPLCLTVREGEKMMRLGEEYGTMHVIGYHKRSDPAVEYAKRIIEEWKQSGAYGDLQYIRITMPPGDWVGGADQPLSSSDPYPSLEPEPGPESYTDMMTLMLDSFVNYYIHQVNMFRHLLGENYRLTFGDRRGIVLNGESDSGVTITLEMAPYHTSHEWEEQILVGFRQGFVRIDLPAPLARQRAGKVTIKKDNASVGEALTYEPILPNVAAMRNQARNFLAAVRGDRPAPCTAKEALLDLVFAQSYVDYMALTYPD